MQALRFTFGRLLRICAPVSATQRLSPNTSRLLPRLLHTLSPAISTTQQHVPIPNRSSCRLYSTSDNSNNMAAEKPVEKALIAKLTEAFRPTYLEVINESHMHNVLPGSESHFKVVVVSDQFENQNLISRHRLVHETLKEELCSAIHALSIQARTPAQWEKDPSVGKSPPCAGGMAHEAKKKNEDKDST